MGSVINCAELNNTGMFLEKEGRIDEAIDVYEKNISGNCYPATHSFDRLMILYRKRKDYDNEIRVIQKAIKIFTKENDRRARIAILENPDKEYEISEALGSCKNVIGTMRSSFGNLLYCFCPYDVNKYKKRLQKTIDLQSKQKRL